MRKQCLSVDSISTGRIRIEKEENRNEADHIYGTML